MTLEAGSIRVPIPAASTTALRTFISNLSLMNRGDECRIASACGAHAFARFLRRFACDTKRGHRPRFEPLDPDLVIAFFAASVDAALDARKRFIDLGQQLAFAIAHAQQQRAVGFESCTVGRVGVSLTGLVVHAAERTLGFLENLALAPFKETAKKLQLPLPH